MTRSETISTAAIATISLVIGAVASLSLPWNVVGVAGIGSFTILMWAAGTIPEYLTGLIFITVSILLHLAPPEAILGGLHSSTVWLLFGGMVVGSAITHTGLGKRIAPLMGRCLGQSYFGMIGGVVAFGVLLAFFLPSAFGRVALLLPVITALADSMGYKPGRPGRTGLLMAAAFGTCLPTYTILPSNLPNMILAGSADSLWNHHIGYFDYLLLSFPILGALKSVVIAIVIAWMFKDEGPQQANTPPLGPMTAAERRLSIVIVATLGLWMTDGLHQVQPGWIALAGAIACLWPGLDLTSKNCLNEGINYGVLFFVAAIMGLGAVVAASGLGEMAVGLSAEVLDLQQGRPLRSILEIGGIATFVAIFTNLPGVPVVMTPGAGHLAELTGLPLGTVLMAQVLAFSNVLLPYQAPPLLMAVQTAGLPRRQVIKVCVVIFLVTIFILTPLTLGWWWLLGMAPG